MGIAVRRTGADIKRSAIVESDKKINRTVHFAGAPARRVPRPFPLQIKLDLLNLKVPGTR